MADFTVKVYPAVVKIEGSEYSVDIGVVQKGVPFDAFYDSWIDQRIYYTIEDHELEELSAGYEMGDGTLVSIDKEDPSIWEATYDADRYDTEECF